MVKSIIIGFLLITHLLGGASDMELLHHISRCNSISIIYNGNTTTFNKDSHDYTIILDSIMDTMLDSHEMPALGVSIDSETRAALQNGMYIELNYKKMYKYLDMPFEKLLFTVDPHDCGINIIRYHDGKYDGRCYYLNLNHDMSNIYNVVSSILNIC